MSANELKKIISDCCNDVTFSYNGMDSGVTSEMKDYIPTFQVWHGESTKEYNDVEKVMSDKFYSGKSLNELADVVKFWIS